MHRRTFVVAVIGLMSLSPAAHAQRAGDVIRQQGTSPLASEVTFPASKELTYRVAFAVNVGPGAPDSIVPGFRAPANFLYVGDANGVPRANVHLAVVVWGTATHSLMKNDAYRALKGADNASIALLEALNDAGVQIIVCGEALINRKVARGDLLPFVKVAPTATMALATLQAQGFGVFGP